MRAKGADFWELLKPLVSKFILRRRIRKLEYEGIYLVCFGCGIYSHRKETCHFEILATIVPTVQESQIRDDEGRESDRIIISETEEGDEAINLEIVEDFGPWMLVKRRIRRVSITQSNQESPNKEKGYFEEGIFGRKKESSNGRRRTLGSV